jgi:hypothetical protein
MVSSKTEPHFMQDGNNRGTPIIGEPQFIAKVHKDLRSRDLCKELFVRARGGTVRSPS